MADKIQVYEDKASEWRWRRVAANGQITATSGEGYEKASAIRAAMREAGDAGHIEIVNGGEDEPAAA